MELFDPEPYRVGEPPPAAPREPEQRKGWLTSDQLAERLGCSSRWVQRQANGNVWPGHKLGREWRFSPEDVAAIEGLTRSRR